MDKSLISKLYLIQLKNGGISEEIFSNLNKEEQSLLEKKENKFYLKKEERAKIKVVITGGVFDLIHMGHVYTLTEAKKHGDILIVSIASDSHIRKKGREPLHTQEYRAQLVEMLKPVDGVLLGLADPKDIVTLVNPDVIVYGYDQKPFLKPEGVEIITLTKNLKEEDFKTGKIVKKLGL